MSTPDSYDGKKVWSDIEVAIQGFVDQLFPVSPNIVFNLGEDSHAVGVIAGADLSGWSNDPDEAVEARAQRFIEQNAKLFGLEKIWLPKHLAFKNVLKSQMGNHVVFSLRYYGLELTDHAFVVHLDRANRIVMATAVFQGAEFLGLLQSVPGDDKSVPLTLTSQEIIRALAEKVCALWQNDHEDERVIEARVDRQLVPAWDAKLGAQLFWDGLQLKISTNRRNVYTVYGVQVGDEPLYKEFGIAAASGPTYVAESQILRDFLRFDAEQIENGLEIEMFQALFDGETEGLLKPVRLNEMTSPIEFSGKYVHVEDEKGNRQRANAALVFTKDVELLSSPQLTPNGNDVSKISLVAVTADYQSPVVDRVMTYYHIDLIQRYFRQLGLDVLDTYPSLMPLVVHLGTEEDTDKHNPSDGALYIKRITKDFTATDARDARILYHEFTHAVTDALARLQRGDTTDQSYPYRSQVLQAAAIDEGLADYFASSLAVQHGAQEAVIYVLNDLAGNAIGDIVPEDAEPLNLHITMRQLDVPLESEEYQSAVDSLAEILQDRERIKTSNNNAYYEWSTVWARYLWQLRLALEPEIADTIIAHSIFFLTRWSTFNDALLSLILADYLLFGMCDLKKEKECQAQGTEHLFHSRHEAKLWELVPRTSKGDRIWNVKTRPSSDHARRTRDGRLGFESARTLSVSENASAA